MKQLSILQTLFILTYKHCFNTQYYLLLLLSLATYNFDENNRLVYSYFLLLMPVGFRVIQYFCNINNFDLFVLAFTLESHKHAQRVSMFKQI